MMEKVLLTSLLICLIAIASFSYGATIYVDAANDTGFEDGTQRHPFDTIGEGVKVAARRMVIMK